MGFCLNNGCDLGARTAEYITEKGVKTFFEGPSMLKTKSRTNICMVLNTIKKSLGGWTRQGLS